ncbi:MAG: hypothetical protein GX325_10125 [Peptococcaceae bacterium]|nr:hypothetical protein [Peptococcaceae bacterium]
MFPDVRGRKILIVAHCIFNQNAVMNSVASYPGTMEKVANLIMDAKIGILQMPCLEMNTLGLDRGKIEGYKDGITVENTRIRGALEENIPDKIMNDFVNYIILQIKEYMRYGFTIVGIVGINRSPTCGVNTTSANGVEVEGEGIFIQKIKRELKNLNIEIPFVGVKGSEPEKSVADLKALLGMK